MNVWHSMQKESVISGLLRFGVRKNWEPCAIRYTEDGLQPCIASPRVERKMQIGQLRIRKSRLRAPHVGWICSVRVVR